MVESAANSQEDYLIDGLSFKLKPGASYVNDRRSVTYHPQGSNIYTTYGTKLIKLLITGDNWLDPSTFRVLFDVVNKDTTAGKELRIIGGAHSFFKRMRILCNGAIVEDIDDYNRVSEMFSILTASDTRQNVAAEAFGKLFSIKDYEDGLVNSKNYHGIKAGDFQTDV